MRLSSLLLCLSLGTLAKCSSGGDWCYTNCEHTPSHWADNYMSCGGTAQSPINIDTLNLKEDDKLKNFIFINFTNSELLDKIQVTKHTVQVTLKSGVEVSGGGLDADYTTLQFHFHWGNKEQPGSEHLINGYRYPMEMHIVSIRKGLSVEDAKQHPRGLAVLGFFINATDDEETEPWKNLTSNVPTHGSPAQINDSISIMDLIGKVNITKFYRYHGSLTTPACNEAVVWTVFQEPINVNRMLLNKFSENTGLTNVYRPAQALNGRQVYASPATAQSHSWCYDEHCDYTPSQWYTLPDSQCSKNRQSPINIMAAKALENKMLGAFTFKLFDYKHSLKYIVNSGHSVKCVLKEDLVEVAGGGLGHVYSTIQFHFHWGSTSKSEGSEHTMDSKRYPMEMHIVTKRKDLTLEQAVNTPNGLAVLGFFIEAPAASKGRSRSMGSQAEETTSSTSNMEAWKKLTKYLSGIKSIGSKMDIKEEISIDDLLGGVSRTKYYRYNGSLTTPRCNEAVVWTVFKESVKVDQSLMQMFPKDLGYSNVFRPVQALNDRTVFVSAASSDPRPVLPVLLLASLTQLHL